MIDLFDRETRVDTIVTAVAVLIRGGGLAALTMRRNAEEARVSQSGLAFDLTNRARLLEVSAARFGARLLRHVDLERGAVCLLPGDETTLIATRVWLAFRELGRSDAGIAAVVAEVDAGERELLRQLVSMRAGSEGSHAPAAFSAVDALHALSIGLRDAVCRPVAPLPVDEADRVMRQLVEVLAASTR